MKRSTVPVIKETANEVKLDNDGLHERKRQRLSRQAKDIAIGNIEKMKDAFEDYSNITSQFPVKFSEAQTSTPIAQNGTNNIKDPDVPNPTDNSYIANDIMPNIIDNGVNGNDPSANNGIEVAYHDESENNLNHLNQEQVSNVNENGDTKNTPDVVKNPLDEKHTDAIENNQSSSIPQKESQEKNLNDFSSFKYDCDSFLNSFLKVTSLQGHAEHINSVIADGNLILSASNDTTIKVWDSCTMKEICNFHGHTAPVTALLLLNSEQSSEVSRKMNLPENYRIAISASTDCSVRFWDISSGVELSSFYTFNAITCLDYVETLHQIALGTEGGKLELWDLQSLKVQHSIMAHQEAISCLKVDECYIYTASTDGLVKVWLLDDDDCNVIYTRRRMQCNEKSALKPSTWSCIASHNGQMYLSDNTLDMKVLNWKEGHIQEMENRLQSSGIISTIYVKEDILFSAFYDHNTDHGGINVWKLPQLKYSCTMMGSVGKISHLSITMTEDKILRVVTGGKELLVWDFITAKPPSQEETQYYCKKLEENIDVGIENGAGDEEKTTISPCTKPQEGKAKQWCSVM